MQTPETLGARPKALTHSNRGRAACLPIVPTAVLGCTQPEPTPSYQQLSYLHSPTTELKASLFDTADDLNVSLFSNYLHSTSVPTLDTTYTASPIPTTVSGCHDVYTLASSPVHSSFSGYWETAVDHAPTNNETIYEYISPELLLKDHNSCDWAAESVLFENDVGPGLQSSSLCVSDARKSPDRPIITAPEKVSPQSESTSGHASGSRKASRSRTRLIKEWYLSHSSQPYASDEQVQDLALRTGLNLRQVRNCLSNLRARFRLQGQKSSSQGLFAVPTLNSGLHMAESAALGTNVNQTHIAPSNSVANFDNINRTPQALSVPRNLFIDASPQAGNPGPLSLEEALVPEHFSPLQVLSTAVPKKRKGKRRYLSRHDADAEEESSFGTFNMSGFSTSVSKPFQCTVCTHSFKSVHEWQRHEVSVHKYHDTAWICMPSGPILDDLGCAFCGEFPPDEEHFEQHNVSPCLQKDRSERQFFRKDGLKQHILRSHCPVNRSPATSTFVIPDSWTRDVEPNPLALWCGFCKATLPSIADRMYHVARHFKNGFTMDSWTTRTEV